MLDFDRGIIDERELDTVLAQDFSFEGEIRFTKPLMIKGLFRGDLKAEGDLYIGELAKIEARLEARMVSIRGHVVGNIIASHRIELHSTARVDGDISTPELLVEVGAQFNGICTMPIREPL